MTDPNPHDPMTGSASDWTREGASAASQWEASAPAWGSGPEWGGARGLPESSSAPIIPFRPLEISDLFSGAFGVVRFNPAVLLGVTGALMSVVGIVAAVDFYALLRSLEPLQRLGGDTSPERALEVMGRALGATASSSAMTSLVSSLVSVVLVAILTVAVADAVIGRKTDWREAFLRGGRRLLPLIGTSLLTGLVYTLISLVFLVVGALLVVAIVLPSASDASDPSIPLIVAAALVGLFVLLLLSITMLLVQTRLLYSPTVCLLEELGPIESIKRSWSLTRGAFGRTLGRYFLILLATGVAAGALSGISGGLTALFTIGSAGRVLEAAGSGIGVVLASFVVPVATAYGVLMYTDERIRREGFALSLEAAASSRSAPGR